MAFFDDGQNPLVSGPSIMNPNYQLQGESTEVPLSMISRTEELPKAILTVLLFGSKYKQQFIERDEYWKKTTTNLLCYERASSI